MSGCWYRYFKCQKVSKCTHYTWPAKRTVTRSVIIMTTIVSPINTVLTFELLEPGLGILLPEPNTVITQCRITELLKLGLLPEYMYLDAPTVQIQSFLNALRVLTLKNILTKLELSNLWCLCLWFVFGTLACDLYKNGNFVAHNISARFPIIYLHFRCIKPYEIYR